MELNEQLLSEVILFWSQYDNRPWSDLSAQEQRKIAMIYLTKQQLDESELNHQHTLKIN